MVAHGKRDGKHPQIFQNLPEPRLISHSRYLLMNILIIALLHQGAKGGRSDVVALMDGRDTVNIEAQIAPDQYFVERAVIYASWVHGDKVGRGERYGAVGTDDLHPHFGI